MKLRKEIIYLLLINLLSLPAYSQQWFDGSLVLSNGNVRVGRISIECDHDLVLFEQEAVRTVYPAHKIQSVYFYDYTTNVNSRYQSLRKSEGVGSRFYLYEVVLAGEIDVLRRKKSSAFPKHTAPTDYNYFIHHNNVLVPLRKFKRKIFPYIQSSSDKWLKEFITAKRLNIQLPANAIRIIEYYNSVVKDLNPIAKNSKI